MTRQQVLSSNVLHRLDTRKLFVLFAAQNRTYASPCQRFAQTVTRLDA